MSKKKELCALCGWLHVAADAQAVGRFQLGPLGYEPRAGGPLGYKARYVEGAKLRSSRAEALADMCRWRQQHR